MIEMHFFEKKKKTPNHRTVGTDDGEREANFERVSKRVVDQIIQDPVSAKFGRNWHSARAHG